MLFLVESDVQKLRALYKAWLEEAFEYEKQGGGIVTSYYVVLSEVKRVKGKITKDTVKEWMQGLPLSIPYITYDIVQMSLPVLSSLPLVYDDVYEGLHIDNTYGTVLPCHVFTPDDSEEFDQFYWSCMTDLIFEG